MGKKNYRLIYGFISIFIFLIFGALIKIKDGPILFDLALMDLITGHRTELVTTIMKVFSFLGSKYFMILALLALSLYYVYKMERKKGWLVINSIVLSFGLNAVLKKIIGRTRPLEYMIIKHGGYSFPSGHSMVSMSFYTTISYIGLMGVKNPSIRKLVWVLNFFLIFLIGYSRMYLGVHWPTDIIAGYLMGFLIFILGEKFIKE